MNRFSGGFTYPFRSLGLLRRHPRLLLYVLIPVAINVVLFSLAAWLGLDFFHHLVTAWLPQGDAWYWMVLRTFAWMLAGVVTLVLVFFCFVAVGSVIAAPFHDLLCQRTEEVLTGRSLNQSFHWARTLREVGRSMWHELRRIWLFAVGMLALLLLYLLPPVGVLLHPLLSFLLMLYFLVMEYTGFVLDRKGFPFRRQREYIRSQRARMMGYGLGVFCLLSVPFLQLLAMPLAVIGATMLYVEHPMAEDPAYAGREEGRA